MPSTISLLALAAATALTAMPSVSAWQFGSGNRVMWDNNCDFYGGDLYSVRGGADRCGDACANDGSCTHWTWSNYNGGTCWLKNGASGTNSYSQGMGCGYVLGRFSEGNSGQNQQSQTSNGMTDSENQEMLSRINSLRAQNGLPALTIDSRLTRAAYLHTVDQANQCTMSHDDSSGLGLGDRIKAQSYTWNSVAENVAAGYQSVNDVMNGWIASPGHLANLLRSSVTQVGFAKVTNNNCGTYKIYWTQDFGRLM